MKQWLTGIIGTSLFASLALALCPQGGVRRVLRFACAILCALALVQPLM